MKKFLGFIIVTTMILMVSSALAEGTHSGQAAKEAAKAGSHASNSAAHAIAGTGQVTSATSAVPLAISGAAGAVATEVANDLMDAATQPIGETLEITDENISAGPPPNEVLEIKEIR